MITQKTITITTVLAVTLALNSGSVSAAGRESLNGFQGGWWAGRWDSSLYVMSDHPSTVAVVVVVEDSETRLPVPDVEVILEGEYQKRPQGQGEITGVATEYKLTARTGKDGVTVFGLLWAQLCNEDAHDDVERIQSIRVRRNNYRYVEDDFNLGELLGALEPGRGKWRDLIRNTKGAKYFILEPGANFDDYNNEECTRATFFNLIRAGQYGKVIRLSEELGKGFPQYGYMSNPQVEAGPFLLLPVTVAMERVSSEIAIQVDSPGDDTKHPRRETDLQDRERRDSDHKEVSEDHPFAVRPNDSKLKPVPAETSEDIQFDEVVVNMSHEAIGLSAASINNETRTTMGLPVGFRGALITEVFQNSPAEKAGLKKDMTILAVDHRSLSNASELSDLLARKRSGDQFSVDVWSRNRQGKWVPETKMVSVK